MNFLKALIGSKAASGAPRVARALLPEVNAFVDVAIGASRERQSIPIDAIAADTLSTRVLPGLTIGGTADFLYTNGAGKFRFTTVCTGIDTQQAHFKLPADIKTLAAFGAKRSAVRLDSLLPAQWRYAPGGQGNGEFIKASLSDLSRGGASLIVGRDLKIGTQVEVRIALKGSAPPLVILSQVMRAVRIETSGKNAAGIRFVDLDTAGERLVDGYIHELQTLRRERGLV